MMPSSLPRAVQTFGAGLIDYAGLFPPAKLTMQPAVENFARYARGEHSWMLGRFVCPVSALDEFSAKASPLLPGTFASSGYRDHADMDPWRISALIDGDLPAALKKIYAFNDHHDEPDRGLAQIDSIEVKVSDPTSIDDVLDAVPEDLFVFFEFPISGDCRGFVAAITGAEGRGAGAKIRTGGITPEAFPTCAQIAAFLHACSAANVPFKATAGLHHAMRGAYALTYEKGSPTCTMHGFLNLFFAAALVRSKRIDLAHTVALLEDERGADFKFGDEHITWRGHELAVGQLARVREGFALSYGSCSFDEPIDELKALGAM